VAILPGVLCPWINMQFTDPAGIPLVGGKVEFFVNGSSFGVHKDTFTDVNLTVPNANPVILDSAGRPPTAIFLAPGGYDVTIKKSDNTLVKTIFGVEDYGQTFFTSLAVLLSQGGKGVTNGYNVLPTDVFVTINSAATNPTNINLPQAANHPQILIVKVVGANPGTVTPNGAETIEALPAPWTIPGKVGIKQPTIVMINDGVSAWSIIAALFMP
jgi:hypothetical protein